MTGINLDFIDKKNDPTSSLFEIAFFTIFAPKGFFVIDNCFIIILCHHTRVLLIYLV